VWSSLSLMMIHEMHVSRSTAARYPLSAFGLHVPERQLLYNQTMIIETHLHLRIDIRRLFNVIMSICAVFADRALNFL
jgi:hypothetical protein